MKPDEKFNKRETLITEVFKELGKTKSAVHVIAQNWSNVENKDLIKEVRDLKLEVEQLKIKKK